MSIALQLPSRVTLGLQRPEGRAALPATSAPLQESGKPTSTAPSQSWRAGAALLAGAAFFACHKSRTSRRTIRTVLPDGTNEEGEDVAPIDIALEDLKDVVLFQSDYSPPCVKLRTIFRYYKLPFRTFNAKHPTSDYQKIPVLVMNDRQINDSHIIMRRIIPWLTGKEMTDEEVMWEKRITYEFQPAFEVELVGNDRDLALLWTRATGYIGGWQRGLLGVLSPLLKFAVEALFRSRYSDMELPSSKFGASFRAALKDQPFFHGEKPGPIDLSLYGTYAAFAECKTAARFLQDSGLEEWHDRMTELQIDSVKKPTVYAMQ
ncbi:ptges2 [Symbiodinium natans]|uniref:Ptges2 protein n=1 Tax=Symbiodinium natans TaxID=878477 RepID=A0A812SB94_9DINO|nr:ptges2 [Symbiodinium natans]